MRSLVCTAHCQPEDIRRRSFAQDHRYNVRGLQSFFGEASSAHLTTFPPAQRSYPSRSMITPMHPSPGLSNCGVVVPPGPLPVVLIDKQSFHFFLDKETCDALWLQYACSIMGPWCEHSVFQQSKRSWAEHRRLRVLFSYSGTLFLGGAAALA